MLRLCIIVGCWLLSIGWAWAQRPAPAAAALTLDDCVRLGQEAPSVVRQARQGVDIARYGLTQARAGFLPHFQVNNAFVYNSPRGGSDEFSFVALNGVREYVSQFNTALELDTSGRLRAAMARARADRDVAVANLALAGRDLRRSIITAYYRLLLTRHLIQVARDALLEAQDFDKRTHLLQEKGEVAQADVVKSVAQVAFLQQALRSAELDAKVANQELASFWTTAVDDPLAVVDVLDQPAPAPESPPPATDTPYLGRLELRVLDAERRGFLADARQARANMLPQTNVVFQYGLDSTRLTWRDRGYATFVNLNIPVFDWFKARSATRQFRLRAEQTQTGREISERAFSRDYQAALARVNLFYEQIAITEAQVKNSQENLRLSRVRYQGGEGLALDVVAAQSQLAQARANYYTVLANYHNARADLEIARGR